MKLVIVEDEEIIRTGIVGSIDWGSLGIEVVGQAEDGEMAQAVIEQTRPDIVVSDIRIPFVDGLTLAEHVTAKYPGTAIVIISGHDDFGYAQKAIKIGVEDYILKPIDPEEFSDVLRTVCRKLEARSRDRREVEGLRQGAHDASRVLRERLLRDFVSGRVPEEEALRRLPEPFGAESWFAVLYCQIDEDQRGSATDRLRLERCLEETVFALTENGTFLLEEAGGQFALVAVEKQRGLPSVRLGAVERSVRRCRAGFPHSSVTIGTGRTYQGLKGLKTSYEEARKASAYRYLLGHGRTIAYEDVFCLTGAERAQPLFCDADLIWAVKLGDRTAIHDNLAQLLAEILPRGTDAAQALHMYIAGIFLRSLDAVLDEGGSVAEVFADPLAVYNTILAQSTADASLELLEKALCEVSEYLEADRQGSRRHAVEKAKRYIRRNFGRSNLNLTEVAEYVGMSPSYLSSTFSAAEGRSFVDYLAELRMERAKDLLQRSPYPAAEIADMVGYTSPAYFSSAFKKHAGCTPGEFRSRARGPGETSASAG